MKIALYQMQVIYGDKGKNLQSLHEWLENHSVEADVLVLPEMFLTGFCVDALELAEEMNGTVWNQLQQWSTFYKTAIVGSLMIRDGEGNYFNRAFFFNPSGEVTVYDKHHLFRMGQEGRLFTAGDGRVIVSYMGWNILLQICYDLRFPVYSRVIGNDYDMILYVASWPKSRIEAWRTMLMSRAIENEAYVCGVNAVGEDSVGHPQGGCSMAIDMKGKVKVELSAETEEYKVVDIQLSDLQDFRMKFPVWKDADQFVLK